MRKIDIFVSSRCDVQKERCLADRIIRSIAAEFNLPVTVSYSNWLRRRRRQAETNKQNLSFPGEGPLLCPCFWEHQDLTSEEDCKEHIPNTGQFDLVICILWSRLGAKPAPSLVMPDGSEPKSPTDYEIAWALDETKRTPGFPALRVYRNRSTPIPPLEPKEEREKFLLQCESVREFFVHWGKENTFVEVCKDYRDLEQFEDLFREHFHDFLAEQLGVVVRNPPREEHPYETNPFRGLHFFDFEHAPVFHGRTNAIAEVLDALKEQATAKRPFVLVLGPGGSGKSSLVRAGVLPLVTQLGAAGKDGPWRRALTRPAAWGIGGDPIDALAAAILDETALPELADAGAAKRGRNLASELREDPDHAAVLIKETLDALSLQELDYLLDEEERGSSLERKLERVELAQRKEPIKKKPKAQLALVVDQLEELFSAGFAQKLQQRYIASLVALVHSQRVFVITTLRSDFYASYQQFAQLVELTGVGGRIDLQPPKRQEMQKMIRFPAEGAGLRFEKDPTSGISLDDALLEAAVSSRESLPLLEHVLSQLYAKQLSRKDRLLRWSDYREMGELEKALANHAETVYSTLTADEQGGLEFIMRQLISLGPAETVIPRAVLYDDLISFPRLKDCQKTGAKGLVDRLIKEGLLSTGTNPSGASTISITHELLLGQWPRLSQFLCRDHAFLQMRDRPDASLKVWLGQGRQSDDLLDSRIGLTVAENLPRNFRSSLNKTQVESVKKSLVNTGQFSRMRAKTGLAVTGALLVIAVAIGAFWWKAEIKSSNKAVDYRKLERGIAERAENWSNLSEAQRKKTEKEELVETGVENTTSERNALPPGPEPAGEKAHVAEQNADLAAGQPKPVPIRPVNGGPGVGTEPVNGGPVVGGPGVGTEPVNGGPVVGTEPS